MDRFSKLVIVSAFSCFACVANAAYSNLTPPPGWSAGGSAAWSPPSNGFAAQTANQWIANAAKTSAMLNAGGRQLAINARLPLSPNASRVAAGVIFRHPAIRTAIGVASLLSTVKFVYDEVKKEWMQTVEGFQDPDIVAVFGQATLNECRAWPAMKNVNGVQTSFAGQSCAMSIAPYTDAATFRAHCGVSPTPTIECYALGKAGQIYAYKYAPKINNAKLEPINENDFIERIAPLPLPDTVPSELPIGTPLPVKTPIINPSDEPNPRPTPFIVPTGDPVPNPQYDPNAAPGPNNQPWIQPGVKVTPSPTTQEPWRVDIQPVNRPVPTPDAPPVIEPLPLPPPKPDADPDNPLPDKDPLPDPDSPDKPNPEEQQSLCEKHPDIIACQKFDDPKDDDLPKSERDISITPDSGWGAETASCPAPKSITVQGRAIAIPYDLFCTYASGMRPIIIAMAWLSAAFILLGARSES